MRTSPCNQRLEEKYSQHISPQQEKHRLASEPPFFRTWNSIRVPHTFCTTVPTPHKSTHSNLLRGLGGVVYGFVDTIQFQIRKDLIRHLELLRTYAMIGRKFHCFQGIRPTSTDPICRGLPKRQDVSTQGIKLTPTTPMIQVEVVIILAGF